MNLKQAFVGFNSTYLTQPLFNACFYALKAIFVLYIVDRFSLPAGEAINLFATFMTLCYGTSLVGGYLADKGLGVKNAITLGGALTSLGLLCILFPSQNLCFLGLSLLSLGSGLFKPNLLTAVGLIFENPKDPQKDKAYSIIYIAGNVGTFIVPAICGFVGKIYGWHYGILLVGAIFAVSTYLVHKTMRFHPNYTQEHERQIGAFSQKKIGTAVLSLIVLLFLLFRYRESFHGVMGVIACGSIVYLGNLIYQSRDQERKDILTVISYILMFALFCTLFEQAGSSLLLFYEKMVDRQVMGIDFPSSAILSLNPLFILICGALLLPLSSRYLEKKKPMDGFTKIGWGFLFAALSFWVMALSTQQEVNTSIPLLWIVGAIFIQTVAELWVVPITLSKISQHSAPHLQSIMMSFWTMAIAYGHYFAGFIAQFSVRESTTIENALEHYQNFFFHLGMAPLTIGVAVLLYRWIKPTIVIQKP